MFSLLLTILSGCSNEWEEIIGKKRIGKELKLKELIHNSRHYQFYYNKRGDVDSISVHEGTIHYVYSVVYDGWRIDSVSTLDLGELVSIHNDFEYDKKKRITAFKYRYRTEGVPADYFEPRIVTYDNKGRIASLNNSTFTYDANNNIATGFGASFTYDNYPNPLYFIDNLFAMVVEEYFLWEFILSPHNMTSRISGGSEITYDNEYDSHHRLIRKTALTNDEETDEFRFIYFN
jgi:hypothetical protein